MKKKLKILLTQNGIWYDTPERASICLPPLTTFRRSSPIRTPEKLSARSTGVGTTRKRNDEHVRVG
jgi:hypothetical protein